MFSSIAGYLLGVQSFSWLVLLLLIIGGYCMVGASNIYNQIIEKDLDALMYRTKNRPLPSGRLSVKAAFAIAVLLTLIGIAALYSINAKTALFGAVSIFLYASVYTPLKTRTPLAVFIGAFPGAIPFMLGWVAATNAFGIEAGTLFMVQFFWQFPHFWSIGWSLHEDYQRAGFKMLPTGKPDQKTALQIVLYSIWTVLISLIPVAKLTGQFYVTSISGVFLFLAGLALVYFATQLYRKRTPKQARILMLISVSYISVVQIIYVLDKFLR